MYHRLRIISGRLFIDPLRNFETEAINCELISLRFRLPMKVRSLTRYVLKIGERKLSEEKLSISAFWEAIESNLWLWMQGGNRAKAANVETTSFKNSPRLQSISCNYLQFNFLKLSSHVTWIPSERLTSLLSHPITFLLFISYFGNVRMQRGSKEFRNYFL